MPCCVVSVQTSKRLTRPGSEFQCPVCQASYAVSSGGRQLAELYTIDPADGRATLVARITADGPGPATFAGLTAISDTTLLLTGLDRNREAVYLLDLDEIADNDGPEIVAQTLDGDTGFATFDLTSTCTGTVYGASLEFTDGGGSSELLLTTVDSATGEVNEIGPTGEDVTEFIPPAAIAVDRASGVLWMLTFDGDIATVDPTSGAAAGLGRSADIGEDELVGAMTISSDCPVPAQVGPIAYATGDAESESKLGPVGTGPGLSLFKVDLGSGVATLLGENSADPDDPLSFNNLAFVDQTLYGVNTPLATRAPAADDDAPTSGLYVFDYSDGLKDGRASFVADLRGPNGEPFVARLGSLMALPDGRLMLAGALIIGTGDLAIRELDDVFVFDPKAVSPPPETIVPVRVGNDTGIVLVGGDTAPDGKVFALGIRPTADDRALELAMLHGRSVARAQVTCPLAQVCLATVDPATGLPTVIGAGLGAGLLLPTLTIDPITGTMFAASTRGTSTT